MLNSKHSLSMLLAATVIFSSGCVSTAERPSASSPQQNPSLPVESAVDENLEVNKQNVEEHKVNRNLEQMNEKISILAASGNTKNNVGDDRFSYKLGPGDVIDIAVFQVDELNRKSRIAGDGYIMIPLIGEVYAQNLTTTELEDVIAGKLGENYIYDPQVSVFVEEFRSHQISVTGAVQNPNVYEIQRARNVLEMLALAGGLSNDAGPQVYVTRIVDDIEQGVKKRESTVIKLDTLLSSNDPRLNIMLRAGDSVIVPKAGVVFVEGAVKSPGAYQIKGDMNVLKAIAVAGDIKFEAKSGEVQIFRESNGSTELIEIDLDAIKSREVEDIALFDGDIIVVPDNKLKKGWSGFWKGISGIFTVGTRI